MAKRNVKSLHSTGRVSRKKASAVAKKLRNALHLQPEARAGKIARGTTASGKGAISFHVATSKPSARRSAR